MEKRMEQLRPGQERVETSSRPIHATLVLIGEAAPERLLAAAGLGRWGLSGHSGALGLGCRGGAEGCAGFGPWVRVGLDSVESPGQFCRRFGRFVSFRFPLMPSRCRSIADQ